MGTSQPAVATEFIDTSGQQGRDYLVIAAFSSLALIFLLLGHLRLPNDGGHALFLPFNSLVWTGLFLFISCGVFRAAQGQLIFSSLSRQLCFACLLLSVPLLYLNADVAASALRILGLWAGLLVFLTLQQFQFEKRSMYVLLLMILTATWIEAGRYWWQMLSVFQQSGVFPAASQIRTANVFQQPNVMASFVGMGLVCSGFLLAEHRQLSRHPLLVTVLLLTPLLLGQLFHSLGSRAGWYGTGLGVALLVPLLYRKAGVKLMLLWLFALMLGLSLSRLLESAGGWVPLDKDIVSLTGQRMALYPQSIALFLDNWLFGVGYGRFEASYIQFAADKYASGEITTANIPNTFHPHNEFLLWGAEGGIVPLAGLLVAAWAVWVRVLKLEPDYRLAIIALFLPVTFHSQVEYPFYHSAMHWLIFILLIALVDSVQEDRAEQGSLPLSRNGRYALRSIGVVLPAVTTAFLLTTVYSGIQLTRFNDGLAPMGVLQSINNPIVWRDKIDYAITSNLLFAGVRSGDTSLMEPYISWGEDIVTREPRPLFYEYLILAYQQSGQESKAAETLNEFYYLFPELEPREIVIGNRN